MTTEEKQGISALLEEIAEILNMLYINLSDSDIGKIINCALERFPVISGRMGKDLKIRDKREEG